MTTLEAHTVDAYRAFRGSVLGALGKTLQAERLFSYDEAAHPYRLLRKQIEAFRQRVSRDLETLLDDQPALEPHVRRALGIPPSVALFPARRSQFGRAIELFTPVRLTLQRARSLLLQVRTYEGREYIFDRFFAHTFLFQQPIYGPATDYAIRRLELPRTRQALDALKWLDVGWVKAAHRVGISALDEIVPIERDGRARHPGEVVLAMVNDGIVQSKDELTWLEYEVPFHSRYDRDLCAMRKARRMMQIMLAHGLEREKIAGLFRFQVAYADPLQLETNFGYLTAAGITDLTAVFEATDDELWRAPPARWSFVLGVIGARSAAEVGRFRQLLRSGSTLSADLVSTLKDIGASVQDLSQCQSLILAVNEDEGRPAPVAELKRLAAAPFSLSVEQIAQCAGYLRSPGKLPDYLTVLDKRGFGSAAAALAFQTCYPTTSAADLDRCLEIAGERSRGQPLDVVAEWVRQVSQGGHYEGYHYLLDNIDMLTFAHLQQALKVSTLGRGMLRFLVERHGLRSLAEIRSWYYNVKGIQGWRWWGREDAGYTLLLDDAYKRNNFSFVTENQNCIRDVIEEQVTAKLGRHPYDRSASVRRTYSVAYEQMYAARLKALLPVLPEMLQQTGGMLLHSVLRSASESPLAFRSRLAAVAPVMDELLAGRGPSIRPTELETEAIAMLYRCPAATVRDLWSLVVGREADFADLQLRERYTMEWQSAFRKLREPLDRRSLLSLAHAAAFADRFSRYRENDVFEASKHLRAKRLRHDGRDPWSLSAHLGVLLAVVRNSSERYWTTKDFETISRLDGDSAQDYERLEQLQKLFVSTLPDALNEHADKFIRRFSEQDAQFLASRLTGEETTGSGFDQLRAALAKTQDLALPIYQRWIGKDLRKFVKAETSSTSTTLSAVLTKTPAAFFAKHAADLCTRNNAEMWCETRLSHLVVFDRQQRRLAGMALIYIEPAGALHPTKSSLIVRAINPMDDMLASHTASSIVDAFFDVAIQIAQDNGLAAVAFPWHNGSHLLSNQPAIEKDMEKRFMAPAVPLPNWRRDMPEGSDWRRKPRVVDTTFFAYERGQEKVKQLYAIWRETPEADQTPPVAEKVERLTERL